MKRLTTFSWGYWGWGNHTRHFVRAVDRVERARGKRPPIFVDIRFSRSVRASGFREAAFERTVGKNRYRWLRKLGNAQIVSARGGIRIADPSGADELLQLVIRAELERRRVIFFCACEDPCDCHRAVAARLLLKAARRKGMALTGVEWPGGKPKTIELTVCEKVVKNVLRGGNRLPLAGSRPYSITNLTTLPWCSRVRLRCDGDGIAVISGPAQLAADWYLPVIGPSVSKPTDTIQSISKEARRLWKSRGYYPMRATEL